MKNNLNNSAYSLFKGLLNRSRLYISSFLSSVKEWRFYKTKLSNVYFSNLPADGTKIPLHIVTIAYNNEALLSHQDRLMKKYITDEYIFVVADNSSDQARRKQISDICNARGIAYI